MSWTIIVSGPFLILYGLGLYLWDKKVSWRLPNNLSKGIKHIHYSLLILTVIGILLYLIDNITYRGQWTTRFIVTGLLLSGIFVYPLNNWKDETKREKIYFKLFSYLPILTAGLSMIPFLGLVIVYSSFFRLVYPVDKVYYEDSKLLVQSNFTGVLAPPSIQIFEKKGLFETLLNKDHRSAADIDSVTIDQITDETLVILYSKQEAVDTIKIRKVE